MNLYNALGPLHHGRAMATGFAEMGHTIIGCARGAADVERLKRDLGPQHSFSVVDITSNEQVQEWAQRVQGNFPTPDLLINNAAIIKYACRVPSRLLAVVLPVLDLPRAGQPSPR